jgi:HAD superfamily hydrolase (TIGR01509 family)
LFDLDGTLIDTGELHYEATVKALNALGGSINWQTYDQNIHGHNNAHIAQFLFPDGSPSRHAEYVGLKEQTFRASLGHVSPVAGLLDLLAWAVQNAVAVGLVTNAPKNNKDVILEVLGLTGQFQPVILGDDLPQGKPHPLPYLTALEILGLEADVAIGFDDSVHGVTAVHRAGMFTVGITTGQTETELIAAGANLCCMDFTDPKLLQNLESHVYFILYYDFVTLLL